MLSMDELSSLGKSAPLILLASAMGSLLSLAVTLGQQYHIELGAVLGSSGLSVESTWRKLQVFLDLPPSHPA